MTSIEQMRLVLLLSAVTLTLPGCETTMGTGAIERPMVRASDRCAAWRPIPWSTRDTDETIRAAKAHNAVGEDLGCWRPKE